MRGMARIGKVDLRHNTLIAALPIGNSNPNQHLFASRHRDFERVLDEHYRLVSIHLDPDEPLSRERRLLIGAYFTHEYSIEGAALFNPSIVPAPDQSGLPLGALRFVMSTRAVGEGHISSIGFRSGVIGPDGGVVFDPTSPFAFTGARTPNPAYVKRLFEEKLREVGVDFVQGHFIESPSLLGSGGTGTYRILDR